MNTIISEPVQPEELTAPYRSYGIHPWYIHGNGELQLKKLDACLQRPDAVAIGEAGLDKLTDATMELQMSIFRKQTQMAEERQLPLIIHCVKAWQELFAVRKEVSPQTPWVIHGFRGNGELAEQLLHQGFYLSFGIKFNPKALLAAWPNRFLAETDEATTDIRDVYSEISKALTQQETKVAEKLAENCNHIFSFFK